MSITRRVALQALATAAATAALPRRVLAARRREPTPSDKAILYDSSRCIGCRECVRGCSEANEWDCTQALTDSPLLSQSAPTVLQRFGSASDPCFRKLQCMHCLEPACVSACMLGAMAKDADGAVTWNADLCVGCRYCQIACPFNVPRFDWDTPLPRLHKCELCPERRAQGLPPACVEQCRRGALLYGTRVEMLAEAHRRIDEDPGAYNPKVFGERDGGGTGVLHLTRADMSFADLGLPELGDDSASSLPESIQHSLYRGFAAPLALLAFLGAVVRRNTRTLRAEEAQTHRTERSTPVGGKLITPTTATLALLTLAGVMTVLWRLAVGLGATTNLNDGYPMGLWIAMDVVTGTALACGGYAVALLVYVANRGRYHPLVRPALLTSALGYTLGGLSVLVDIGRPWNFYRIPMFFWDWNFNSILLEVALCIMLYTTVLWIEVSPAVLEGWKDSRVPQLRRLAVNLLPRLEKALPYIIALGLLLPTMHQSSLGSMMLIAGPKLHPLWHTPLLPLLFLVSCVAMGYAAVTLECCLSARAFKRPLELPMLRALALPIAAVLLTYATLRVGNIVLAGKLGLITRMDGYSLLFLLEMALFLIPAFGLVAGRRRARAGYLTAMAVLVVAGGALYRFSTFLFAFNPGAQWSYFPSLPEFAVSVGFISAEILGYLTLVKLFPILRGTGQEVRYTEPQGSPKGTSAGAAPASSFVPESVPAMASVAQGGFAMRATVVLALTTAAVGVALVANPGRSLPLAPANQLAPAAQQADLRCLTRRPDNCLSQPVSPAEPHGANCATCHNLWDPRVPPEVTRACTASDCHGLPTELSSFHRSVHSEALTDCVHCHRPHDFRAPANGDECTACHKGGGQRVTWATAASSHGRTAPAIFRHETHTSVTCARCHGAGEAHENLEVVTLEDCRSCHHQGSNAADCTVCHPPTTLNGVELRVTRSLQIRIGSLDRPLRLLPFDHANHADIGCRQCHTSGSDLRAAAGADCSACHAQHHVATADCSTCHEPPAAGSHDVRAHLGCGGTGCHEHAPEGVRLAPRTRNLCLSCHTDRAQHKPDRECADCHILPEPVGGN